MWWLTLRLQRAELLLAIGAIIGIIGVLVATQGDVDRRSGTFSVQDCPVPLSGPSGSQYCWVQTSRLTDWAVALSPAFIFLPIVLATLLVLPTILELSSQAYRLAWTQSVLRRHWALSRVVFVLGIGVTGAIATAITFAWWFHGGVSLSRSPVYGWQGSWTYDLRPLILTSTTVFAIGLVFAVGTIIRRPIVSIVVVAIIFVIVRIPFSERIRPVLLPPKTSVQADYFANRSNGNDWSIDVYILNSMGDRISSERFEELCAGQLRTSQGSEQCLTANGLTRYFEYQPYSRLMSLQVVETSIFVALGLAMIGWTVWYWLRRLE